MIDLIAIRARDEDDYATAEVLRNIQWAGNTDPELTATINMVADRRALLSAYDALAADNAALRKRCKEHEQFRHQHRDCDAMGIENQALRKDAERLDWIARHLFEGKWDGTIGRPKYWTMTGPYRHTLQKMHGNSLREAIDAAMGESQ